MSVLLIVTAVLLIAATTGLIDVFMAAKSTRPKKRYRKRRKARKSIRKTGFVYLYYLPHQALTPARIKIGFSTQPEVRAKAIKESLPYTNKGSMVAVMPGSKITEAHLHSYWRKDKVAMPRGVEGYTEWFSVSPAMAKWARECSQCYPPT